MSEKDKLLGHGQSLHLAPQLFHLDVHFFTQGNSRETFTQSRSLMQYAAACRPLPTLQSCRIRGLHCDPDDLLLLLQSTKPKLIDLQHITTL